MNLNQVIDPNSGRIDAQNLAEYMGVPPKALAKGLGLNHKAVRRDPSGINIQPALRPVKRSLEILEEFFGPVETVRAWLNTPHPDLDDRTALETILAGKAEAVNIILENALNGIPI